MARTFLPRQDKNLRDFAINCATRVSASPGSYGLSGADAARFQQLTDDYVAAMLRMADPATRTRGATATKNDARKLLRREANLLSNRVQGTLGVSDKQKLELGLTVAATTRTRVARPSTEPTITILWVDRNLVSIHVRDKEQPNRRRRPAGVVGYTLLVCVSQTAPAPDDWNFAGNHRDLEHNVRLDRSLPPGTKVWLRAFWRNTRDEPGPSSTPVCTLINHGLVPVAA